MARYLFHFEPGYDLSEVKEAIASKTSIEGWNAESDIAAFSCDLRFCELREILSQVKGGAAMAESLRRIPDRDEMQRLLIEDPVKPEKHIVYSTQTDYVFPLPVAAKVLGVNLPALRASAKAIDAIFSMKTPDGEIEGIGMDGFGKLLPVFNPKLLYELIEVYFFVCARSPDDGKGDRTFF